MESAGKEELENEVKVFPSLFPASSARIMTLEQSLHIDTLCSHMLGTAGPIATSHPARSLISMISSCLCKGCN